MKQNKKVSGETRPVVSNAGAQVVAATRAQAKEKAPARQTGRDLRSGK